jgi:DNA-binding NarL/FixJ family response regulator
MSASRGAPRRNVLLIEPDGLVRGTVASVCRELQLARVRQAISVAAGEQWLKESKPDGVLMSLAEGEVALDFLTRLRAGAFDCDADLPVAVMAREGDAALVVRLKELDVRRLLLQPFRLRDVIHTLEQLWPAPEALAA